MPVINLIVTDINRAHDEKILFLALILSFSTLSDRFEVNIERYINSLFNHFLYNFSRFGQLLSGLAVLLNFCGADMPCLFLNFRAISVARVEPRDGRADMATGGLRALSQLGWLEMILARVTRAVRLKPGIAIELFKAVARPFRECFNKLSDFRKP